MISLDSLSLVAVNSATAVLLGASMPLAIEVVPWISHRYRWLALVVVVLLWSGGVALASTLEHPYDLIGRRGVNTVAQLYIAALVLACVRGRHLSRRRAERKEPQ